MSKPSGGRFYTRRRLLTALLYLDGPCIDVESCNQCGGGS